MVLVQLVRWLATIMPQYGVGEGVWRDRRAVTSIEYVIIAIIIAISIMGGLSRVGGMLGNDLNNVSTEL